MITVSVLSSSAPFQLKTVELNKEEFCDDLYIRRVGRSEYFAGVIMITASDPLQSIEQGGGTDCEPYAIEFMTKAEYVNYVNGKNSNAEWFNRRVTQEQFDYAIPVSTLNELDTLFIKTAKESGCINIHYTDDFDRYMSRKTY
jgi:hypothetical protein